jgi:hypothetical protein
MAAVAVRPIKGGPASGCSPPDASRVDGAEYLPGVGSATKPGGTDAPTRADDAPDTGLDRSPAVAVPVVLPKAIATVDETGHARIAVENIDHRAIDCPDGPVGRDELGAMLARIAEQVGGPFRVEVREPDGSRYADILQPRPPEPKPDDGHERNEPDEGPLLQGEGFLADETVLVAFVVATTQAHPDGTGSLVDLPLPAGTAGEVILLGGASGRIVQRHVPVRPLVPARRWWRR